MEWFLRPKRGPTKGERMNDYETREPLSSMCYWWPRLLRCDVPQPQTVEVMNPLTRRECVEIGSGECETVPQAWTRLMSALSISAMSFTEPFFLRTDVLSGKHFFVDTCYVQNRNRLSFHVQQLLETAECADMMGFPTKAFYIRKYIQPFAAFRAFKGFPVAKEWRVFIRDGLVECAHFYWPEETIMRADLPNWKELLQHLQQVDDRVEACRLATLVGREFREGFWSVDVMFAADGSPWVIDMADGERSFHDECETRKARGETP